MRPTSLALFAGVVAALAINLTAQAPQTASPPVGGPQPPRTYPAPTNLKVLPKDLTGKQVHELMENWAGSLGVHCDNCHAADPTKIGPNGRPRLNFADDSKEDKDKARLMYRMTEDVNKNYVSMMEEDKGKHPANVTCGTCHRGHKEPEEFVIPPEEGPRPPQGAAPAETKPAQLKF